MGSVRQGEAAYLLAGPPVPVSYRCVPVGAGEQVFAGPNLTKSLTSKFEAAGTGRPST